MADPKTDEEVFSTGDSVLVKIMNYLKCEHEAYGVPFDSGKWQVIDTLESPTSPQQENGDDCGVFALFRGDYLALNIEPDYDTSAMNTFRLLITLSIMNGSIV